MIWILFKVEIKKFTTITENYSKLYKQQNDLKNKIGNQSKQELVDELIEFILQITKKQGESYVTMFIQEKNKIFV